MLIIQKFICIACGHEWELSIASAAASAAAAVFSQNLCPACGREKARRVDAGARQQNSRMIELYRSSAGMV